MAVFLIMVPADFIGSLTTKVIVAVACAARLPRLQLIVVVPLQVPCEGVAETSVNPTGKGSFTITPVAVPGP